MDRHVSLWGVLVVGVGLAVAAVGVAPLGAAVTDHVEGTSAVADADDGLEAAENESANPRPGERFAGAVGVQAAEIDAEVDSRAFGLRLAAAETDEERAAVIAEQLERNERRLDAVAERQSELRDRRAAGELSEGAHAARMAKTVVDVSGVSRTTDQLANASTGVQEASLAERGVDGDQIRALRDRADELSGPEVAALAREIGGNRTGAPMGPNRGGDPGVGIGPPETGDEPPGAGDGPPGANGSHPGGNESAGHASDAGHDDESQIGDGDPNRDDDRGGNERHAAAVGEPSVSGEPFVNELIGSAVPHP